MKYRHIFKTAVGGVRTHKGRSALTVLGIIIGVMAIIMVMAIGKGAEELILGQIRGMGSRTMSVEPGRMPKGMADMYEMYTESLGEREVEAIKNRNNVRGDNRVAPFVGFMDTVSYEGEKMRTMIQGASELWMEILNVYPEEGHMFSDIDVKHMDRMAGSGSTETADLFGATDAVGK